MPAHQAAVPRCHGEVGSARRGLFQTSCSASYHCVLLFTLLHYDQSLQHTSPSICRSDDTDDTTLRRVHSTSLDWHATQAALGLPCRLGGSGIRPLTAARSSEAGLSDAVGKPCILADYLHDLFRRRWTP